MNIDKMTTDQLRSELISTIQLTNNKKLLIGLSKMINIHQEEKLIEFSESQKSQIHQALQQIENGEFLTEEEAEKEIDSWLEG